ncbi:MAG: GDSL-type esterase/lipase family protein [Planctomycetota bacterium]|nr:GDSL-type esterase/lipase family protein [Planctomycetota bacterium]
MLHCRRSRLAVLALACLAFAAPSPARAEGDLASFPLKDGDTWVMAGDSITAQHFHSNYFEAFCVTRFPQWKIRFRNSGIGGDTVPRVLARFDRDVAVWKPTVVSVELGMNDVGGGNAEVFVKQMGGLVERIEAIKARPVLFSSSPVNDGTVTATLAGRNKTIDAFVKAQKEAFHPRVQFADQFHALLDRWGRNKNLAESHQIARDIHSAIAHKTVPHPELLQAWLDAWGKSPESKQASVDLTGDGVHPGPLGQVTMCAALLKELNGPGEVSAAELDAAGKVVKAERCEISDVKVEDGTLSFSRLDACVPMPVPTAAIGALAVMPEIADLNRWMLTVKGLKPGSYAVRIDGVEVAKFTAEALAKGCNLGVLGAGPAADQGQKVLAVIATKEFLVGQFRAVQTAAMTQPKDAPNKSAELLEKILAADELVHATAQPRKLAFVVAPVK